MRGLDILNFFTLLAPVRQGFFNLTKYEGLFKNAEL